MSRRRRELVAGLSGLALLSACSDPAPSPADASVADVAVDAPAADVAADLPSTPKVRDLPDLPVSEGAVVEPGVRRERFFVDAPAPPPNPATMAATPAMFNRVPVMRSRVDVSPAVAVRAVVGPMPMVA